MITKEHGCTNQGLALTIQKQLPNCSAQDSTKEGGRERERPTHMEYKTWPPSAEKRKDIQTSWALRWLGLTAGPSVPSLLPPRCRVREQPGYGDGRNESMSSQQTVLILKETVGEVGVSFPFLLVSGLPRVPFPRKIRSAPPISLCRAAWPLAPALNLAPGLRGGCADKQSALSEKPVVAQPPGSEYKWRRSLPVTEVHQTRNLGGLIGTRLGSGTQLSQQQQEGGLGGPGRGQGVLRGEPWALSRHPRDPRPWSRPSGTVSSNKWASCSVLKTIAELERVCFLSKDDLLL